MQGLSTYKSNTNKRYCRDNDSLGVQVGDRPTHTIPKVIMKE